MALLKRVEGGRIPRDLFEASQREVVRCGRISNRDSFPMLGICIFRAVSTTNLAINPVTPINQEGADSQGSLARRRSNSGNPRIFPRKSRVTFPSELLELGGRSLHRLASSAARASGQPTGLSSFSRRDPPSALPLAIPPRARAGARSDRAGRSCLPWPSANRSVEYDRRNSEMVSRSAEVQFSRSCPTRTERSFRCGQLELTFSAPRGAIAALEDIVKVLFAEEPKRRADPASTMVQKPR